MFESIVALVLTVAAIGAGLMAGVYFAFSAFIMRAFDQLGAAQATDSMNAINEVILRSWFMSLFFGSTLAYAVLSGYAVLTADLAGRWWLFSAGLVYLVGMFLCTVLFNVPLNNRLAASTGNDAGRGENWPHYYRHWTRWNHLRTGSSLAACVISTSWLVAHA